MLQWTHACWHVFTDQGELSRSSFSSWFSALQREQVFILWKIMNHFNILDLIVMQLGKMGFADNCSSSDDNFKKLVKNVKDILWKVSFYVFLFFKYVTFQGFDSLSTWFNFLIFRNFI